MHPLCIRRVEFAVPHPSAGGHVLQLAGPQDGAVAHAISVFQRSLENIGNDLHVAVAMHPKALAWLHAIVVDHSEGAEAHECGVVIVAKGERVVGIEPTVIQVTSLSSLAYQDHGFPPFIYILTVDISTI